MSAAETHAELLSGFIDESIDALAAAGVLAVQLESDTTNPELIGAIFRPIHSLKGNAAYFGLMKLKKLAHALEDVLDRVRKRELLPDNATVTLILQSLDALNRILQNVRSGRDEIGDGDSHEEMVAALDRWSGRKDVAGAGLDRKRITAVLQELMGCVGNDGIPLVIELEHLLSIDDKPVENKKIDGITDRRISGQAGELCDSLLKIIGEGKTLPLASGEVARMFALLASLRNVLSPDAAVKILDEMDDVFRTFADSESGIDTLAAELLRNFVNRIVAAAVITESEPGKRAIPVSSETSDSHSLSVKSEKTMRIPEHTLDEFLYGVGELLGVEEMLRYLLRIFQNGADTELITKALKEAVNQFSATSKDLQVKIMAVRKVEARVLLQKSLRVIRDIALLSAKQITTVVVGEELKIDKSYIELLDAPLTHLVRNAADHGIETPQMREAAGKNPQGTITVTLSENAETLRLEVRDDGGGLHRDALQKKGIELGIVRKGEPVTQDVLIDLLFRSGVSTAEKVTEISGRGVGMDVVRQSVGNAGGTIAADSIAGEGTVIVITVPRNASTQILDGYIVKAFSGELYVFPLSNVIDAFVIEPGMISRIAGKRRTVLHQGKVIPLYVIDTVLNLSAGRQSSAGAGKQLMEIVAEWKTVKAVFAVEELMGIQKVVCKPVDRRIICSTLFDGAAISGTGQISMVLNVEQLFSDIRKKK